MGDQIQVVDTGKDPYKIEGTDPRGAYEQYEGAFDELIQFGKIEEGLRKGEYNPNLPDKAKNESKFITGKRRWVNKKIELYDYDKDLASALENAKPDDRNVLYPTIQRGLQRRDIEFKRAGSQNLEAIIKSTPDKKLGGLINYLAPIEGLSGEYKTISELHAQVKQIKQLLDLYENGKEGKPLSENTKEELISGMRGIVEEYFRTNPDYLDSMSKTGDDRILKIKSDRAIALGLILDTLKYSDRLVLTKINRIYKEKSKAFNDALKGNVSGYVKASLMKWKDVTKDDTTGMPDGKEYVHQRYEALFNEKYKKQGQEE